MSNDSRARFAAACVSAFAAFGAASSASRGDVRLAVSAAGGAQYTTVTAALNTVPASPTQRYVIDIAPGTYKEQIRVTKPMVTLRGTGGDAAATVLTYFETAQPGNSLANASTAIQARDFIAQNLTFENTAGKTAGVALAMYVKADRAVFDHVRFLGWQDTLRSETGRHYFRDCYVEGSVDFIYGKGQAYFEDCTLYAKSNGYVTAQGREGPTETNGFVFHRATVTGSAAKGSVYLGRPWQAYSRSVFLESTLGEVINGAGWATWSGNNHLTSYFAEYTNTGPGAAGTRASWSYQLAADQVAAYSMQAWLSGSDNWNPRAVLPEPGLIAGAAGLSPLVARRRSSR